MSVVVVVVVVSADASDFVLCSQHQKMESRTESRNGGNLPFKKIYLVLLILHTVIRMS